MNLVLNEFGVSSVLNILKEEFIKGASNVLDVRIGTKKLFIFMGMYLLKLIINWEYKIE
jgi:hypothetical protein